MPVLSAAPDEAIDSATLFFLVRHALEEKEEQEELRRKSKKEDEEKAWLELAPEGGTGCLFLHPLGEEEEEEAQVEAASEPSSSSCPPCSWRARLLCLCTPRDVPTLYVPRLFCLCTPRDVPALGGPVHRHWTRRRRGRHELPCSSKTRHKPPPPSTRLWSREGGRGRRLRSHWRHGEMAIQVAALSHHSALRGWEGDHEVHHTATVHEHLPHHGARPAPTFEVQPLA